jgi:hypothetical protein
MVSSAMSRTGARSGFQMMLRLIGDPTPAVAGPIPMIMAGIGFPIRPKRRGDGPSFTTVAGCGSTTLAGSGYPPANGVPLGSTGAAAADMSVGHPLPPDEIAVEVRDDPQFWIFVQPYDFLAPDIATVFIEPEPVILRETVVVNETIVLRDRGFAVNPGIEPAFVAAAIGRPVPTFQVQPRVLAGTAQIPGAMQVRAEDLRRPDFRQSLVQQTNIRATSNTIQPAANVSRPQPLGPNERGRLGLTPPRAASGLAQQPPQQPGAVGSAPPPTQRPGFRERGVTGTPPEQQPGLRERSATTPAPPQQPAMRERGVTGAAPQPQPGPRERDVTGPSPEQQRGLRERAPTAATPEQQRGLRERGPTTGAAPEQERRLFNRAPPGPAPEQERGFRERGPIGPAPQQQPGLRERGERGAPGPERPLYNRAPSGPEPQRGPERGGGERGAAGPGPGPGQGAGGGGQRRGFDQGR